MTLANRLLRLETNAGRAVEPGAEIDRIVLVSAGDEAEAVEIFRRGKDGTWLAVENGEVHREP